MEDYRELGSKYLSRNKKRSFITVLGCFIVAAGLFMFLNSIVCWVEKCRIDAKKDGDYEIIVLTDDRDIIEKVANEDFVASAYLGKVYSWVDGESNEIYANALHINVKEKLLINYYSKYITKTYGVETELNDLLSWTYCQDNEGVGYLMLLFLLFVSFVLAIIGVGVLRNNISISAMERVKDYGNLRCIGATKKQIRAIVYRESFFLETVGMVAGIAVGFLLSIPICQNPNRQYPIGFHILPIIFLMIAFYGDMYFAVGDGLKKVLAVSPAEAVRGNYRIKAKGVKRRRSGIWKLLFGVEGDYAYKNIKRNNGRFIKTVFAMTFGMVVVVVIGGWMGVLYKYFKEINSIYGYYQHYIYGDTDNADSFEEQKMDLYSPGAIKRIAESDGISEAKYMYQSTLYTAEDRWVYKHLDEEYKGSTYEGKTYGASGEIIPEERYDEEKKSWDEKDPETGKTKIEKWREDHPEAAPDDYPWTLDERTRKEKKEARKAYRDSGKGLVDYAARDKYDEVRKQYYLEFTQMNDLMDSSLSFFGYDEEDYKRFEDYLVEGTLDLSENGILLVNSAKTTPEDAYYKSESILMEMKEFKITDLKLGDKITVVDPYELYTLVQEERKNADAYDKSIKEASDKWEAEHKDETDENGNKLTNPYEEYTEIRHNRRKEAWIIDSAREKLVEEGKCKTFIVEGIVSRDPNYGTSTPALIAPLDKFFEITGRSKSDYNGIKFHVSNIFSRDFEKQDFQNAVNEKQSVYYDGMEESGPAYYSYTSPYLQGVSIIVQYVKGIIGVVLIVFVLISISLLNTLNVTISGLQMRRSEFAQLRAMGMTKRSLLKAVLLEGGIVWIVSTILGIILGIVIEYASYITLMKLIIDSAMYIFLPGIIITAILSLLVLSGSNYIFFKQLRLDIAGELLRSGE